MNFVQFAGLPIVSVSFETEFLRGTPVGYWAGESIGESIDVSRSM